MKDARLELFLKIILAILLSPAAAFWQVRLGAHFWLNLILFLLTWVGGVIHALYLVVYKK
jgi:uncharacterized membrane protein YqaE (UPF0057 family)